MKNYIRLLLVAAISFVTEAKWNACGVNEYSLAMLAFNQGFQADTTLTSSECIS